MKIGLFENAEMSKSPFNREKVQNKITVIRGDKRIFGMKSVRI